MPACNNVNGKIVCGKLHAGGKVPKAGLYRLAKGEKVYKPNQLKAAGKAPKKKCKCGCKKKH
jgi:hypothetical protein